MTEPKYIEIDRCFIKKKKARQWLDMYPIRANQLSACKYVD